MKLLIKVSIALVAVVFIAITMLLIFVDPNDYKAEIEAQVKQSINRDLHIKGDIGWTFFPQLGLSSGEIELDNLTSFKKPHLLKIEQAALGINILPLLKGEISIAKLTLDGFELTLITNKNGVSNLDNMGSESSSETAPMSQTETSPTQPNESSYFDLSKTQLGGIDINNAMIEVQDLQSASYQKITINEIKLGEFALNRETELQINTKMVIDDLQAELKLSTMLLVNNELDSINLNKLLLNTIVTGDALPNGQLQSTLKSDISYSVANKKATLKGLAIDTIITADNLPNKKVETQLNAEVSYLIDSQQATINDLKIAVDKLNLEGRVTVQTGPLTKVRYDLIANEWDLNPYIEKSDTTAEVTSSEEPAQPEIEPDLSFLKELDIDGTLKIAGLKVEQIKIGEVNKHLIIKQGKAQLQPLTVQLYQGLLTLNGTVDESNGLNKYKIATTMSNVQLHPLLTDAAQLELLSGATSFNFNGNGQGLTSSKIKQGITGKGDFSLIDGELYGVNIPQEIRILKAKLKGQNEPTSDSIKKTDFASLTGNFSIAKGLVNNQKMLMLSPVMRLDGAGLVDIIKENLDYKLSITPLSKSTEQTDYLDLKGVTIPLLISGTFNQPSFSIDTDSVLKEQLQQQLAEQQQKIQEKAQQALKKHSDKLDSETQDKLKKEGKRLEDTLKSFF